jgi:hypothetical protein
MNIGTTVCIIFAISFFALGCAFTLLKEKGALLISGFNTLSKEQRKLYNQKKMSIDFRNMFIIWFALFFVGALLSQLINAYLAIIVFILWLILFFKEVHLDADRAFAKYRVED